MVRSNGVVIVGWGVQRKRTLPPTSRCLSNLGSVYLSVYAMCLTPFHSEAFSAALCQTTLGDISGVLARHRSLTRPISLTAFIAWRPRRRRWHRSCLGCAPLPPCCPWMKFHFETLQRAWHGWGCEVTSSFKCTTPPPPQCASRRAVSNSKKLFNKVKTMWLSYLFLHRITHHWIPNRISTLKLALNKCTTE